ncbi:hypothetical protein [Bradyrhizobium sp. CCBAU 11434]|uniref:hypothetical protein n=1 Tax=Bradyrhizobium sp. CCBAU 11434 TaxID=1630885 RepID=UPI002305D009|nr:hypothetical protein [Bradyrhizobium sp. CCBAU 11434]
MQKPRPRVHFVDEADEQEHVLNCACWMYAEDMALELDLPPEFCADRVKAMVLDGRLIFEVAGERVRLMPAPSLAEH